jgi:hypothetical protein
MLVCLIGEVAAVGFAAIIVAALPAVSSLWAVPDTAAEILAYACLGIAGAALSLALAYVSARRNRKPLHVGAASIVGFSAGLLAAMRLVRNGYITPDLGVIGLIAGAVLAPLLSSRPGSARLRLRAAIGSSVGLAVAACLTFLVTLFVSGPEWFMMGLGTLIDPPSWDSAVGQSVIWLLLSLGTAALASAGAGVAERAHAQLRAARRENPGALLMSLGMLLSSAALVSVTTINVIINHKLMDLRFAETTPMLEGQLRPLADGRVALVLSNIGAQPLLVGDITVAVLPILAPLDRRPRLPMYANPDGTMHVWSRGRSENVGLAPGWQVDRRSAPDVVEIPLGAQAKGSEIALEGVREDIQKAVARLAAWETEKKCSGAGGSLGCSMVRVVVTLTVRRSQLEAASPGSAPELYYMEDHLLVPGPGPMAFMRLPGELIEYPRWSY